jgi:hypothetical protein
MAFVVIVNAVLAVIVTYAALRAYDVVFGDAPDPATVVWSAHIAMFWRLGVGAYAAGLVAILVTLVARQDLAATTRVTVALVPIVGAMIAIQGALLP